MSEGSRFEQFWIGNIGCNDSVIISIDDVALSWYNIIGSGVQQMCVLNVNTGLIARCNYICCPYPSHGWKLCLVPVLCGAGMAKVDILLCVLTGKIDVMQRLVQMHRT